MRLDGHGEDGGSSSPILQRLNGTSHARMRALVASPTRGLAMQIDVPFSSDDYIHRGGRTARAGAVGEARTFVSPADEERLSDIEKAIGTIIPRVVIPTFDPGAHVHVPPPPRRGRRRRA